MGSLAAGSLHIIRYTTCYMAEEHGEGTSRTHQIIRLDLLDEEAQVLGPLTWISADFVCTLRCGRGISEDGTKTFYLTLLLVTNKQVVVGVRGSCELVRSLGSRIAMKTCMRSPFIPNFSPRDVIPFSRQTRLFSEPNGAASDFLPKGKPFNWILGPLTRAHCTLVLNCHTL